MPEGVAAVAAEETHVLRHLTLTAETGIIGGMPQGRMNFGTALNFDAVIHPKPASSNYDGGGHDLACLERNAQADAAKRQREAVLDRPCWRRQVRQHLAKAPRRSSFAGTFTEVRLPQNSNRRRERAHILPGRNTRKFITKVEQIPHSAVIVTPRPGAGPPALYPERCVLERTQAELEPDQNRSQS